jgi:replicative DNA helicase
MAKQSFQNEYEVLEQGQRVPPQAVEVEEGVLGAMLLEKEARDIVYGEVKSNYRIFYKESHRIIYHTMWDIRDEVPDFDLLVLETKLRDRDLLERVGGSGYLSELTRSVSSAATVERHCKILLEKYIKRQIILDNTDIIKEAYEADSDPFDLLEKQAHQNTDIQEEAFRNQAVFVSDLLEETLSEIEEDMGADGGITGVPTGLAVDKYTGGWQDGDLIIIGARPSIGKTAFALDCSFNAALFSNPEWKTDAAIVNMEMKNTSLIKRKLAERAGVNSHSMRRGTITDADFQKLISAAGELYNTNILLDETTDMHILELQAKAKRWKKEHDIGLLVVDYLQLMSGDKSGNREQEISSISRGLKKIAKELDIPVIALSQLSRACLNREGAMPRKDDLRESGAIEQDADVIILLNRPEYFDHAMYNNKSTEGKGWVIVDKQRNGPTGRVIINFNKQFARWENPPSMNYLADSKEDELPQAPMPHSIGDYEVDEEDAPF